MDDLQTHEQLKGMISHQTLIHFLKLMCGSNGKSQGRVGGRELVGLVGHLHHYGFEPDHRI